jgi:glutaredoxin
VRVPPALAKMAVPYFDDPPYPPEYRVYTKPGCPHCDRAKDMLYGKGISVRADRTPEAEQRQRMFSEIAITYGRTGWNTSPMIFSLDDEGFVTSFVGGADDLASELAE